MRMSAAGLFYCGIIPWGAALKGIGMSIEFVVVAPSLRGTYLSR